jgi:hypothetical protein
MNPAFFEVIHGFLYNRAQQESRAKDRDRYRDILKSWVMEDGREDENGHRYLDFEEPLVIEGKAWAGIQAQRRISTSIDLDATEELAKTHGIYDAVFPIREIREFDEDALYRANQQGIVSDEELDGLLTENVTFAIVPVKA